MILGYIHNHIIEHYRIIITHILLIHTCHQATFLAKVLPVGICCAGPRMKFPDSEIQLPPAFIGGGGRGCPIDCLRLETDKLPNFSAVSETPRTDLPLFIEAANNQHISFHKQ